MFIKKFKIVLWAGFCAALVSVGTVNAKPVKHWGIGAPAYVTELPAGSFRSALEALSPKARGRALSILQKGQISEMDLPYLRVDQRGGVFFEDPIHETDEIEEMPAEASSPQQITLNDAFNLNSKPGASRTVYIDFDGHSINGTVWNNESGHAVHPMKPYDTDGDPTIFSSVELNVVADVWRRLAEDLAPYDVNVTTTEPAVFDSTVGHILVTRKVDENNNAIYTCSCGGVAYYGGFGNTYLSPGLVFQDGVNSVHSIAEAAAHELGHNLYLAHDGTSTKGYYYGHGSGYTDWAPIMGVGYNAHVTQWSKGEYTDANNQEDDLTRITSYIPYDTDDHADTDFNQATPLVIVSETITATTPINDPDNTDLSNKGIIGDRTDRDLFYMDAGIGTINLDITPVWIATYISSSYRGANLDIQATLYDELGKLLTQSNPLNDTNANITYTINTTGRFYLEIEGIGKGTSSDGYSDYGSLGQYFINGTVPDYIVATTLPTAPTDLVASLGTDSSIILNWIDIITAPEANEAGYRVLRSVDGSVFVQVANLPRDSQSYSDNNLSDGDYSYKLELYNTAGTVQTTSTASITVDVPTVAYATGESTIAGIIQSGSYLNTQIPSESEILIEEHSGGRPSNRVSSLNHTWDLTGVTPGAMVTLFLEASALSNSDNEDFIFTYSINGGPTQNIGILMNGTGTQQFSVSLPADTSGTIQVNVIDDDRTAGNRSTDQISIYRLNVTSIGDAGNLPPSVSITQPLEGENFDVGEMITFTATAADNEDGDLSGSLAWSSNPAGLTGSGASIMTNLLSEGSYAIMASVTDSANNVGSDTTNITISVPSTATSISVSDLDGTGVPAGNGGKWQAQVTVEIKDDEGTVINDATVSGSWSTGSSSSCTTGSNGRCMITKGGLKKVNSSVSFSITDVSGSLSYNGSVNTDPDSDSNGTSITVTAP